MILLSPQAFVSTAGGYVGLAEHEDCEKCNHGRFVTALLRQVCGDATGDWSAAFIYHAGYWAHHSELTLASSWPLPPVATARDLAAFADTYGALVQGDPQFGDIFVLMSHARKEFVRAGIIVDVLDRGRRFVTGEPFIECRVIEGNSAVDGALAGRQIARVTRRISVEMGDRFIRWSHLTPRGAMEHQPIALERAA
jgi:hypothetical protein